MKLTKSKLKEIISEEIQKLNEFKPTPYGPGRGRASAILPIGVVNLKTGANKMLDNVYDVWPKSYVNVFKNLKGKYVGVASAAKGSGKFTMKKYSGDFVHDQNQKYLGRWTFVEEIPMTKRDKLASKYKSFRMYTYK